MRIKLSECEAKPEKITAIENYCKKNDKLLALRDMKQRLLAVGLSIKSLQTSKSKEGFNHYNVIYKEIPVAKTLGDKYITEAKYIELKNNNFLERNPIYDVYICVYEGMITHEKVQDNTREQYWYKCYEYFRKYTDRFSIFDLINKTNEKGGRI